ncbi:MAG: undecaprenyl-diphosphatase UppP [Candidatus Taylorbacteria bacterium]
MDIFQVIILSIVEGITEFLPISSTGHLILASHILGLSQTDFLKSFEIAIQLGAVLSVIFLYGKSYLLKLSMIKKLVVAFIPTALLGLLFYSFIKKNLLGNESVVLFALGIGGVLIIIFELILKKREEEQKQNLETLTYKQAFLVGLAQSVAIIPGVSRSATTVLGGRFLGLSMKSAVEFSFLLALPTMLAATGLDLVKNWSLFTHSEIGVLFLGFILSFTVAVFSIKFLLTFIKKYSFISFGVYRIFIALLFWTFLI